MYVHLTVYQLYINCIPTVYQLYINCIPTVYQLFTNCIPTVYQLYTNCIPTTINLRYYNLYLILLINLQKSISILMLLFSIQTNKCYIDFGDNCLGLEQFQNIFSSDERDQQ